MRNPRTAMKSIPCSPQLEKARSQQRRSSAAKNKQTNKQKWYKWTYLQNRNRLTDVENKLMVTGGKVGLRGVRDKLGDLDWDIHTTVYKIDN